MAEDRAMRQVGIEDWLEAMERYGRGHGLTVREHPRWGGVGGGHAPNSFHHYGEAGDITIQGADVAPAYTGGEAKSWQQRTGELRWRLNQLNQGGLFNELLGPGDKGHDTHVHLAKKGKSLMDAKAFERAAQWAATGRWTDGQGNLQASHPLLGLQTPSAAPTATQPMTQPMTQPAPQEAEAPPPPPDWRSAASDPGRSINPGEGAYWEREDMKQWAAANPALARSAMLSAGVPLAIEDRGALGGTRMARMRLS